jgi:Na+-transporting NADH:ubiquinone oxidoreductase subunit C
MSADKDSIGNTLKVAFGVCLVCAVVVSTASVALRPQQVENRLQFRQVNILQTADMYTPGMDVQAAFERIERRFVDLDSGEYVERPDSYDQRRAARDAEQSRELEHDPAGIRRRADVAEVYLTFDDAGALNRVVLPVHGAGLWSTMYAFLALEPDLNTIAGIRFYEHGETPGLGGEIDNPRWQRIWEGKQLRDDDGQLAFQVIKGQVAEGSPESEHRVDGLSGATITARGVNNLVRFWVGEQGFGPYLARLGERIEAGAAE